MEAKCFVRKLTFDDAVEIFYILLLLRIEMNTFLSKLVIWLVVVQQHIFMCALCFIAPVFMTV